MSEKNKAAIYRALHSIPAGKVATYGQIARMANCPGAARLVGTTLRNLPEGSALPWHRVINAQGKISFPPNSPGYFEQRRRLQNEGIEFHGERINLVKHLWH